MSVVMFDVDGVLAAFDEGYRKVIGLGPKTEEPPVWDWDILEGCTPEQIDKAWEEIKLSWDFWYNLSPLPGTKALTQFIHSAFIPQHQWYFVTNRPGRSAKRQTEDWLQRHVALSVPTVIVSAKKGDVAAAIGANYAIDDKAGNVVYGSYQSPKTHWFVLDYPCNRFDSAVVGSKVERVKSVEEFLSHIK